MSPIKTIVLNNYPLAVWCCFYGLLVFVVIPAYEGPSGASEPLPPFKMVLLLFAMVAPWVFPIVAFGRFSSTEHRRDAELAIMLCTGVGVLTACAVAFSGVPRDPVSAGLMTLVYAIWGGSSFLGLYLGTKKLLSVI